MMLRSIMVTAMLLWALPAAAQGLSGKWQGDDGASYYLRQVGDELFWYAEGGRETRRSSLFTGKMRGDTVLGTWVDLPKEAADGKGELHLAVREKGNVLEATRMTGGFSATRLIRAGYKPPPPPIKAECLDFIPDKLSVRQKDNRFLIAQEDWWLFDFGPKEEHAYTALNIIRHYGANQSCFIGKPEPAFRFLLGSGRAPFGQWYGEDCVPFRPTLISLVQRQGRWLILDEELVLFDFGAKEAEARAALAVIKEQQFTHACYIGRPAHSFEYLRR